MQDWKKIGKKVLLPPPWVVVILSTVCKGKRGENIKENRTELILRHKLPKQKSWEILKNNIIYNLEEGTIFIRIVPLVLHFNFNIIFFFVINNYTVGFIDTFRKSNHNMHYIIMYRKCC